MSQFPKLPTCAPWCTSLHTRDGSYCRTDIDSINGPAARTDIEVNIIRVGDRDYVQVLVEDNALMERHPDMDIGHYEVRLSPADAGVLGGTLRDLDYRGALMFGNALYDAMTLIRDHGCRWDWCVVKHDQLGVPPSEHRSGWQTVAGVEMQRHLVEQTGATPDRVFVRLRYREGGKSKGVLDVSPAAILDMVRFAEAIEIGEIDDLMSAFRQAAADLGVTE
ncbi:hypothetical protein ACIBQ1_51700 [Nonomuraea sp. NPDC050153]|uniref:hypothetical protein n=1 Tax=Nonomuraea sp. NPDC050153 TaxID=3364359 RepID=UPI003794CE6A